MRNELTEKQRQILEFILKFIEERGAPPTLREITERFEMSSPASAQGHLEALKKKGYIRRRGFSARGIEPIWERIRRLFWQRQGIPLVGRVAAGKPILAEENIEDVLTLEDLFHKDGNLFALRVQGDSMIEAGIFENDILIVRQQATADTGDVVVAIVGDEGTVKRLSWVGDRMLLEPANPKYPPIIAEEARIVGKVIGVIRDMTRAAWRVRAAAPTI